MNKIKLRRLKKKISDNKVKVLLISLISLSLFMGTGYAILSTRFNVGGKAEIIEQESNCNVSFEYKEVNKWGDETNGYDYIINFLITNKTDEPIYSWIGEMEAPEDLVITSSYFENILYSNGSYVLEPYGWNSTLQPGTTLIVELMYKYPESDFNPKFIKINDCIVYGNGSSTPEPDEPDLPGEDVELTGLKINPSEYAMTIGETAPLQVEKTPSNATADLIWTSSDNNIVSVTDSGVITALANGTATITVSSGTISATSTITVLEKVTPPSNSDLDIQFSSPYYSGKELQFRFVITNNSNEQIKKFSFELGVPEGSTYSMWNNPGATVTGNTFDVSLQWVTLNPGGYVEITGQIMLPDGYDAADYLSPSITNIQIKD